MAEVTTKPVAPTMAQAPVAGGAPAPAVSDAPPSIPSGPGLATSTTDPSTGATTMPNIVAPPAKFPDPPVDRGADAEFIVLHHFVGSGRHLHRRGARVTREDFGPNADMDWLLSQGAVVQIARPDAVEDPGNPLKPPKKTDPRQGLPRGGVGAEG